MEVHSPSTIDNERPAAYVDPEKLETDHVTWTPKKIAIWSVIAIIGAVSWSMIAIFRGETVNAIWFVFAAVCSYLIG